MGMEVLCNQCGNDRMENIPLRIVNIVLRLTALIMLSAYGAIITSFMTVKTIEIPFSNLEEFLQNGKFKLKTSEFSLLHIMIGVNKIYSLKGNVCKGPY